jgi:3',5'-cyclic AMP phosphodiesterase CpdA
MTQQLITQKETAVARRWVLLIAVLALVASSMAGAQTGSEEFFIQLADTQFGAFDRDRSLDQETANYEFAVVNINRLRPKFVVICGDLINKVGDPAQSAEYFRITAKIDSSIRIYPVAGNHDVGNEPTPDTLAYYRQNFGKDYYSFREGDIYGIVLNSSLIGAPAKAQADADRQEAWLKEELAKAKNSGTPHIVVFQHHSWFLENPTEPTQYFNIPLEQRKRYLDMLKSAGVRYVFAGHYHRNAFGTDGELEMITNGPVGMPLGNDPSGIRIVTVRPDRLEHRYFTLGNIPNRYPQPAQRGRGGR